MTWFKPQSQFCQSFVQSFLRFFQTDLFIQNFLLDWGSIYMSQDIVRKWTRRDFLCVAGKSKFFVEHFLMGILSRSWSFHIRTWNRNAKMTRLVIFISFKIWHRNTTRNATSFWISRYTRKITSGSSGSLLYVYIGLYENDKNTKLFYLQGITKPGRYYWP